MRIPRLPYPASSVLPQEQTTAIHSPPTAPSVWPCLEPAACRLCGPPQERLLPSGVPRSAGVAAADPGPITASRPPPFPWSKCHLASPPLPLRCPHLRHSGHTFPNLILSGLLFLVLSLLLTPVLGTIPGAFKTHPTPESLHTRPPQQGLPSPLPATVSLEARPNDMGQHFHHIFASLPNSPSTARTRTPRPMSATSCLPHICLQHS